MSETANESVVLKNLVTCLSESLKQSSEYLERLQSQTKKLATEGAEKTVEGVKGSGKREVGEDKGEPDPSPEAEGSGDEDAAVIRELERQRLELVMSIQRQEYTIDRFDEILEQNHMMSKTVKQFLEELYKRRRRDLEAMEERVDEYSAQVVGQKVSVIEGNISDTQKEMVEVSKQIEKLSKSIESETEMLSSEEFSKELNGVIARFNKMLS